MRNFSKAAADDILGNRIDAKALTIQYPELKDAVMREFSALSSNYESKDLAKVFLDKYKTKARLAISQIEKNGQNKRALNAFLPEIVKARIAVHIMEQLSLSVQTGKTAGRIRLNLWDGFILQKVLFKHALERKPVSTFWFRICWPLISNKKILMPLVSKKGIYCFYSKKLLQELAKEIGGTSCLEIGAGDGTLSRFLADVGVSCQATDDYSWEKYIKYPPAVEKLDASQALQKYKPATVICSWPPPGNTFEKNIFNTESVNTYIMIGTQSELFSGNHDLYQLQDSFSVDLDQTMSGLVLPPSAENAVYIFRRKIISRPLQCI